MNNQTKKMTEGAMMVAIVGMLLFINRQLAGMLEMVMYWVLTFPILMYTARYGVKSACVPAISMVLLSFMIAAPTTIFYLFSCDVVGIVYGAGIRKKWKNGTLLLWTGIFTFVSYLITTVLFAAMFGYDPADDVEMVKMLLDFMHIDIGIPLAKIVTYVVIGSAILMTVLQTMCIHMIANVVLKRMHIETRAMKSIFEIKVPKSVGYIIIMIWVLFLVRNVLKLNQDVYGLLLGVYGAARIFAIGYGVMTLLCILLLFRKRIFLLFVIIGMFLPYVQGAIAIIGVLDMIVDLRGIWLEVLKRGVVHGTSGEH